MKFSHDTDSPFQKCVQGLGLEIGKSLLPGFTNLMQTLTGFFNTLYTFSQQHPQLFAALTKTVTALFSVAGGLIAIKGAASVFKALSSWILGGVSALKALWGLVLAHPFVAIGTAVVAAVALVIKHWDKVKAFFENLWEGLKMGFQSVVDFFKETFAKVWDWIVGKFNAIKDFFGNIGGKVGGFFKKLWPFAKTDEAIESVPEAPKSALADVKLSPPANFQAANTNRTLNNNVTFHINGANDPKTVAQEVEAAMKRVSGDILYDRGVSGGFFTS